MTKKEIHYLEHLIEKTEKETISEAEQKLLDDFLKHEYNLAEWDAAQMGLKKTVSANIYNNIKKKSHMKKSFSSYYKYAVAATVAIVIGAGLLLKPTGAIKEITFATNSVTDSVKLKDGTTVYLAANSTFKYPEHFEGNLRSVSLLKGNAFFKVAKDAAHPFVITSADIKTKVLGTSFHISLEKEKSSVTVITGHVKVSSKDQVAFLKPNENVVFTQSGGLKKAKADDIWLYDWYKQDIQLDDVTLDKVFTLLNFKYGVSFEPEDKAILNTKVTLYLKSGLPLQNILNQINYITNLKFRLHGDIISVNH